MTKAREVWKSKTFKISTMIFLTGTFFLVEIIVGHITNSLALIGDSYHMLSDIVALCVGLSSVRISKWETHKNTFGWARAEVLGALVNSVFLLALCFTIFVEAVQRIYSDEHIDDPDLMLIVGAIGLVVNLIGLGLFHNHGHSHGGGGHSHSHNHQIGVEKINVPDLVVEPPDKHVSQDGDGIPMMVNNGEYIAGNDEVSMGDISKTKNGETASDDEAQLENIELPSSRKKNKKKDEVSSEQLNMRGVFLHVMGDALGSVIVIISALCIKYIKAEWKYKVDPAMSMCLVIIIFSTTVPLLKASAMILLQTVPTHIRVQELQSKLIKQVEGVLGVHELHIWQLAGNRIIASAHIRCQNLPDYMKIAEEVKTFFHNEGIHSTTIQPEFVELEPTLGLTPGQDCSLECGPDLNCYNDTCCPDKLRLIAVDTSPTNNIRQRGSVNGSTLALSNMPSFATDNELQPSVKHLGEKKPPNNAEPSNESAF